MPLDLKVSNFKVGDPVCSFTARGLFAEFIVVDQTELLRVPEGCNLAAAGVLPVAFGTSHVALIHRVNLSSGLVLLFLGAAGGAGLATSSKSSFRENNSRKKKR